MALENFYWYLVDSCNVPHKERSELEGPQGTIGKSASVANHTTQYIHAEMQVQEL